MANSKRIIPIEAFNQTVTVYISDNPEKLFNSLKSDFKFDESEKWDCNATTFTCEDGTKTTIILPEDTDAGEVAHESLHAVCSIFNYIGVSMSPESEEAYAYLLGHLTLKIIKMLCQHTKKAEKQKAKNRAIKKSWKVADGN